MWWLHIKFTLAVVLLTLMLVLMFALAKTTKREVLSFDELKDSYASLKDDIYFR